MAIKKAYLEVIAHLEANKNRKVSTVLDEIKAMCEAKNSGGSEIGKTFLKDENGETIAIYCYYFKKWMPLCDVEFGLKKSTASGYNTMCKEGVSHWTKQQRVAKKSKEQLLERLTNDELDVADLANEQDIIEALRKVVVESDDKAFHFETADEVLAYINVEAKDDES